MKSERITLHREKNTIQYIHDYILLLFCGFTKSNSEMYLRRSQTLIRCKNKHIMLIFILRVDTKLAILCVCSKINGTITLRLV